MCSASQQSPLNSGSAPSTQHPVPTQNLGVESLSIQAVVLGVNVSCDFQCAGALWKVRPKTNNTGN